MDLLLHLLIGHIKGRLVADLAFFFNSNNISFIGLSIFSGTEFGSSHLSDIKAGKSSIQSLGHIHSLPLNFRQLLLLEGYLSLVYTLVLLRLLKGAGALEAIGQGLGIGSDPEWVRLVQPLQEREKVTIADL